MYTEGTNPELSRPSDAGNVTFQQAESAGTSPGEVLVSPLMEPLKMTKVTVGQIVDPSSSYKDGLTRPRNQKGSSGKKKPQVDEWIHSQVNYNNFKVSSFTRL